MTEPAVHAAAGPQSIGELFNLPPSQFQHVAHFCEHERYLIDLQADFVKSGLNRGEACILAITSAHAEKLRERLASTGINLEQHSSAGTIIVLDAEETLARLMVNGMPDHRTFFNLIFGLMEHSRNEGRDVRICGEMIALLWMERNFAGAIRLEELWNDLMKQCSFSLLCTYPMSSLEAEMHAIPLTQVCANHSYVYPGESFSGLKTFQDQLQEILLLQRKARSLENQISERFKVEEKLRETQAELEKKKVDAENANRSKDEFLATISHELRTPLNSMLGWTKILSTLQPDPEIVSRAVSNIEKSVRVQAQLIEDLLDVSRLDTGKLRLNCSLIELAPQIQAAVETVRPAAQAKQISIHLAIDSPGLQFKADPSRIQQIMRNLLYNSIKFTSSGGGIEVRLFKRDGRVIIEVRDNGEGIRPDFLPHVFEIFRQADATTTRAHGGLGVGLAIVRQLVELHGGSVEAESRGEGLGSTFRVKLPSQAAAAEQRKALNSESVVPSLANLRILVVDDQAEVRELLETILTHYDSEVKTVDSVEKALELVSVWMPDVLVSDIAMPGTGGYELIRKIRSLPADEGGSISAVALTALNRLEDQMQAIDEGFDVYVSKSAEPEELLAVLSNLARLIRGSCRQSPADSDSE
jgi:signal transduction histidine kinase/CheY-like chemotaxis protein